MLKKHDELIDVKISMEKNLGQYLKKQKSILNKKRGKIKKLEEKILILEAILISNGTIKLVQNEQKFNTQDSKIIEWLQLKDNCTKAEKRLKTMENSLKCEIINYYICIDYNKYNRKEAFLIGEFQDILILYYVYDYSVMNIAEYYNCTATYIHRKIKNL